MSEFGELLKELENLLKVKRTMHCNDLLKWAEEKGIGPVTLLSLIDELVQRELVEASAEQELVDEHLELALPKRISLKRVEAPPPRRTPERTTTHQRRRGKRAEASKEEKGGLLRFIYEEDKESARESQEGAEVQQGVGSPGPAAQQAPVEVEREPSPVAEVLLAEREYIVALQYLHRYWSVGEIRFESDMKSLGVQNVPALVRKLQSEGLIEIVEPGVINAKREALEKRLSELSSKLPSSSLADLFLQPATGT